MTSISGFLDALQGLIRNFNIATPDVLGRPDPQHLHQLNLVPPEGVVPELKIDERWDVDEDGNYHFRSNYPPLPPLPVGTHSTQMGK